MDEENSRPVPAAVVKFKDTFKNGIKIIPVFFITNKTMEKIPDTLLPFLAGRILAMTVSINKSVHWDFPSEIQMDCDWTLLSRKKYFRLLELLKQELLKRNCLLSVTIRLHQIKYSVKTGVPPADKGLLMFYNMGRLDNENTENSILDPETASVYLAKLRYYPLKLDIALPLYSWVVVYRRGRPVKILNFADEKEIMSSGFFTQKEKHKFMADTNTYFKGYYFYRNDLLRIELTDQQLLEKSVSLLRKNLDKRPERLVFFHLDDYIIKKFSYENLEDICSDFN